MQITYFTADVSTVIQTLASTLLSYVAAIALLFLIGAGVYYAHAGGDPEKQKRGKQAVTHILLGLLLVTFSYAIVKAFEKIAS